MNHLMNSAIALVVALGLLFCPDGTANANTTPDWVEKSNEYTQLRLEADAKFIPEGAAANGLEGYDEEIFDLSLDVNKRRRASLKSVIATLEKAQAKESNDKVRQDIRILIDDAQQELARMALEEKHLFTYFNVPQAIFGSIRSLLDPQNDASRYPAAVIRMNKYTGLAKGYTPVLERIQQHFKQDIKKNPDALGPYIEELRKDIENAPRFVAGLRQLFESNELEGWEPAMDAFEQQLADYTAWLEKTVMPRAREDFRLPAELYASNLKNFGVDWTPEELIERASAAFMDVRLEMAAVARRIAEERDFDSADYRDVIRELKKDQFTSENIMPAYRERLKELEAIVREHDIVSLPDRDAIIRLASEAESAAQPAPHMQPPRMIGNTGEQGQFVLPLNNPNATSDAQMDDFLNDAIAWTLTVHEARPGHEMQFAAMVENGVSQARMLYAFNSANVEGWALYAEAVMLPYLPLEGQLMSLQMRQLRAARAFLDPMLNLGMINRDQAHDFLLNEVVLSEPMATQEVDRYTFRAPGQANAYFYGHSKLQALRTRVELALRDKFDERAFHDYILAQGMLPPDLLAKAVMEEFVPSQR